jgi:hypothetical protein
MPEAMMGMNDHYDGGKSDHGVVGQIQSPFPKGFQIS